MSNILENPGGWLPSRYAWGRYILGSAYSTGSASEDSMSYNYMSEGDTFVGTVTNTGTNGVNVSVYSSSEGYMYDTRIEAGQSAFINLTFTFYADYIEFYISGFPAPIEVELSAGGDPGPGPVPSSSDVYVEGFHVYEIDKGWSFDGAYIPHFAELNWYFGEDPFTDKTIQKVRIHGLSKGRTFLSMAVAGMQVDYDRDFTEPQHIDLPLNAAHISTEFIPTTNYVDSSNWGVSLQLRFEGRNTDLARPEPSHVLQVLALQGSPQGNGARNN